MQFADLVQDTQAHILGLLDLDTLVLRTTRVCRAWHALVQHRPELALARTPPEPLEPATTHAARALWHRWWRETRRAGLVFRGPAPALAPHEAFAVDFRGYVALQRDNIKLVLWCRHDDPCGTYGWSLHWIPSDTSAGAVAGTHCTCPHDTPHTGGSHFNHLNRDMVSRYPQAFDVLTGATVTFRGPCLASRNHVY